MSSDHTAHAADPIATRRGYLIGFAASAVLTAIPFWLVMSGVIASPTVTGVLVVLFAVAQIMVHTICFLHVNAKSESGWTLIAYLFTGVVVLITITGSLWIMFHLNSNMMPGVMSAETPAAATSPMPDGMQ